ncbi:MAG: hypothetical protein JO354_04140 [Verrucomicrobia bacterium]|nr:hypothetical protein [Verrucomicrobiota bacterium]
MNGALDLIARKQPQIVILDLFFGHRDVIWLIKDLTHRFEELLIIAFGVGRQEIYGPRVLRAGAAAYVSTAMPASAFTRAITRAVAVPASHRRRGNFEPGTAT